MPSNLSDFAIKNLKSKGDYRVSQSLYVRVKTHPRLVKEWRIRQTIDGKRKWIYIGSYPAISPKQARAKAAELLSSDQAPQEVLREQKQKKVASARRTEKKVTSFAVVADDYIKNIKRPVWNDRGRSEQSWQNTLNSYILPVIGKKEIEDIYPDDVVKVLKPIWTTKHETAVRTRSRVENIIDYAIAKGISEKRNPAQYKNLLENLLPKFKPEINHHAALPFDELPGFISELWDKKEGSYDALKLISLTQVRSNDAREAVWDHFDLQNGVWMCPIQKLGGEVHKLPIPKKLLWLLQERIEVTKDERLFPGLGRNKFISSNALDKSLDVFSRTDAVGKRVTIHGFRSTFMDWATATGAGTREDADRQLGHRERNAVLAAYMRTDLFDRRAKLIQEYEDFAFSDVASSSH
tara:strand:- start:382 stop:1605 length:1224 start_codon:yes stop_codon:yes gene_type:complete